VIPRTPVKRRWDRKLRKVREEGRGGEEGVAMDTTEFGRKFAPCDVE